jgi:hypothetical protein
MRQNGIGEGAQVLGEEPGSLVLDDEAPALAAALEAADDDGSFGSGDEGRFPGGSSRPIRRTSGSAVTPTSALAGADAVVSTR